MWRGETGGLDWGMFDVVELVLIVSEGRGTDDGLPVNRLGTERRG